LARPPHDGGFGALRLGARDPHEAWAARGRLRAVWVLIMFLAIAAAGVAFLMANLVPIVRCAMVRRTGTRVTGSVTGNDIKRAANGASWRVPTVDYTLDGHEYDARLANYTSNAGLPEGTAIPLAVAPKDPYRPVAVELSSWPTVYWCLIPIGLGALGALCVGIR
jgi:hypothetical protein